ELEAWRQRSGRTPPPVGDQRPTPRHLSDGAWHHPTDPPGSVAPTRAEPAIPVSLALRLIAEGDGNEAGLKHMTETAGRGDAQVLDRVVVRFAGDSGDGMQLTGDRFTSVSASFGNDLSTLPDFPAEIRAPAGSVNGVSSFQVHISDHEITTPGDEPNVLVAMNPAALRADLGRLETGGTLIVNEDAFDHRNLVKAGYVRPGTGEGDDAESYNPLTDGSLDTYRVIKVPMTSLTKEATASLGVKPRDAERSKNFFALGLVSWMYTRPIEPTLDWIARRFANNE